MKMIQMLVLVLVLAANIGSLAGSSGTSKDPSDVVAAE